MMKQIEFIRGTEAWFNISETITVIHYINKSKDRYHMINSIGAGKAFAKIQNPFMKKKSLNKVGIEETYLKL